MAGQRLIQLLLGHDAQVGKHAAELAAGALLFLERVLELHWRDQALFGQHLAQPDSFPGFGFHQGSVDNEPSTAGSSFFAWSIADFTMGFHASLLSSTTMGFSRITSSVFECVVCLLLNKLPRIGMEPNPGV